MSETCDKCGRAVGSVGVGGWSQPWRFGWELCGRCVRDTSVLVDGFAIPAHGSLQEGDETVLGVVEAVSLTAYFIAGRWVPFSKVHGPRAMVQPSAGLLDWGLA